jgi:sugar phosphate isomerase/epimerase
VTGGGGPTTSPDDQAARVAAEAARIRPIAEAAAAVGCPVALYNHGGWFGEPENQVAIIDALGLPNVGIVYNLHHGHHQLERFEEMLETMAPHLLALNLNGMDRDGEAQGRKILPVGDGEEDARVLEIIRESGWRGPVGILDHVPEADAEEQLRANLDGLERLLRGSGEEAPR